MLHISVKSIPLTFSCLGVSTPRAQSPRRPPLRRRASSQPPPAKSVKFNLAPPVRPNSPTQIRKRRQRANSSKDSDHDTGHDSEDSPREDRQSRREHDRDNDGSRPDHRASKNKARDRSPTSSDSTVDLPERFDEHGRPVSGAGVDPIAEKIQELFSGNGTVGRFLQSLGGGSDEDEDRDRDRRRRRRRR